MVNLTAPGNGSTYLATASVTLSANATAPNGLITRVDFYAGNVLIGTLTNAPYIITGTGLAAGSYALTARATDNAGNVSTSSPVNITVTAGTGAPYGLKDRGAAAAFLNMPPTFNNGPMPPRLSQTGAFMDVTTLSPATGLVPYTVNTPLWSDGAVKTRWLMVPNNGAPYTPGEQVTFAPTGEWTFPSGTVFVKDFELITDETNPSVTHRLETRLLVRDTNGYVYGVTYKWRPDYSDADLLTDSLTEPILVTNATGVRTQMWYYPSPTDCLTCHTPVSGGVLGVKTRQLNGDFAYPGSGRTDNQLRNLNHLGLFYPAFSEASISNFTKLVAVTNASAPLVDRARSYLDANCAQCHRPGGARGNFDTRWDTPLANQNLINGAVIADLGIDNARVVVPQDIWRSLLYQRADSLDPMIKMPPLARNLIDASAVATLAAWINSLPGTPALAPPVLIPAGGLFNGSALVTLQPPGPGATLRYTLDGSLPTASSILYSAPFTLTSNATVKAKAFQAGFNDSVAATATFTINALPLVRLLDPADGAEFIAPTNITLNASASDPDGGIGKVEFFQGSTKLGQSLGNPYTVSWPDAPAGNYTLYALATDNLGAT
ncbi:MAG TPA: Ig-like domain-containing protein, partial [Candidatus Binatia bacterium]|nr:Ig-like domain-containing protein [Candidatus Binatia bacterium]